LIYEKKGGRHRAAISCCDAIAVNACRLTPSRRSDDHLRPRVAISRRSKLCEFDVARRAVKLDERSKNIAACPQR
jgi:hypothetical protein